MPSPSSHSPTSVSVSISSNAMIDQYQYSPPSSLLSRKEEPYFSQSPFNGSQGRILPSITSEQVGLFDKLSSYSTVPPVPERPTISPLVVPSHRKLNDLSPKYFHNPNSFQDKSHEDSPINSTHSVSSLLTHLSVRAAQQEPMEVPESNSKALRPQKKCFMDDCDRYSQRGIYCIRHGGGKRCIVKDCSNSVQSKNRCKKHGGGLRCQKTGCMKSSQGKGFCRAHGGGKKCAYPGCDKGTQLKGLCAQHGGSRQCRIDGCNRNSRGQGLCAAHGGGKRCDIPDCHRPARKQNKCSHHLKNENSVKGAIRT